MEKVWEEDSSPSSRLVTGHGRRGYSLLPSRWWTGKKSIRHCGEFSTSSRAARPRFTVDAFTRRSKFLSESPTRNYIMEFKVRRANAIRFTSAGRMDGYPVMYIHSTFLCILKGAGKREIVIGEFSFRIFWLEGIRLLIFFLEIFEREIFGDLVWSLSRRIFAINSTRREAELSIIQRTIINSLSL